MEPGYWKVGWASLCGIKEVPETLSFKISIVLGKSRLSSSPYFKGVWGYDGHAVTPGWDGARWNQLEISHQARKVTKFIPGTVNFEAVMHRISNIASMHSFNHLFIIHWHLLCVVSAGEQNRQSIFYSNMYALFSGDRQQTTVIWCQLVINAPKERNSRVRL